MKIIKLTRSNHQQVINQALQFLQAGGLVIYPTETVYGAGVDPTNQQAVNKLLAYKSRREGKPLSIAVVDQPMAEKYVQLNQQAKQLYQQFLPGPYTIISESKSGLAQGVASEFNSVGIRIPQYPLILELVKKFNKPITATSANASNKKRPYTIADILNNLSNKQKSLIDLIIDAGTLPKNEPSVVIDTTLSTPLTVRDTVGKFQAQKTQNNKLEFITHSDQETQALAGKLMLKNWNKLKKNGLIIGLDGELGAGKTIFAKGIAKFLQIQDNITSPTYNYIKEYNYSRHQVKGNFFHLDLWRIDNKAEMELLQIEQLPNPKNVVAVEWWAQAQSLLPTIKPDLVVTLQVLSASKRNIIVIEQ